ncbi:MAG: bifunctional proline dehydrogenase/L-glutamate gamma-semialdehyde dehydrogenase PutA [Pseudomonadota bacterium]
MISLDPKWDINRLRDEGDLLAELVGRAGLTTDERAQIVAAATRLVERVRSDHRPGVMEVFLGEYGLSSDEGVALMCLAEALLRVPDASTIDALIEDKIAASDWSQHIGQSSSPLVNASTWGLFLTGRILDETGPGIAGQLHAMVRRLGEPVIRSAVAAAMREMGRQFVLGETIGAAMTRAGEAQALGYTYSYDMLGEAAITAADATRYAQSYSAAIDAIALACDHEEIADNPGISIKMSALHPRYEVAQQKRVMRELVPVLRGLVKKAADAGMGLNIDAEEMDRLGLSMAIIDEVLADPALQDWDGFGVVVQAYGRRASDVISNLYQIAKTHQRKIMIRLVKGAYWDTEIKQAQVEGLSDFPVFTQKAASDVSYIANAKKLLGMTDYIYPQFATHNAHTICAVMALAKDVPTSNFEFQRLHGMGEAVYDILRSQASVRCRIYAPVGAHRDLLAYLVRRLLENGANSSFVHQIADVSVAPELVAACPFEELEANEGSKAGKVRRGTELFEPERPNSVGFDLSDVRQLGRIDRARVRPENLRIRPILHAKIIGGIHQDLSDPSDGSSFGQVQFSHLEDVDAAFASAKPWDNTVAKRAEILNKAADLYEQDFGVIFGLLAKEAGKTLPDAVAELREAVDFIRYYAAQAQKHLPGRARGIFTCISPWNFPLAIFTGQVVAALAAGNAVLAKPAETTNAIASWAVEKLHQAGVPRSVLQFLPGSGQDIGAALAADPRVNGVAFTGSTMTAKRIQAAMAEHCTPGTPLIAETGGLNAMVVDSTALPEQAIRDILASAFQSAGQRCSALRCLYVQEDVAEIYKEMLIGAMDTLKLGDPWALDTDIGPVITQGAKSEIDDYVDATRTDGRILHQGNPNLGGGFVAPALVLVSGVQDLGAEVFGPVLHFATFKAKDFERVIKDVNASGYGLTFGIHTRIDDRVQYAADMVKAGNVYANRNQIGAIVGSQPFGGEGLSGTGPKAGGPNYLRRFVTVPPSDAKGKSEATLWQAGAGQADILPGPTGELNRLWSIPRDPILCCGPGHAKAQDQKKIVEGLGGQARLADGDIEVSDFGSTDKIGGVIWWGDVTTGQRIALCLSKRDGPIVPIITDLPDPGYILHERHLCVDTTAAGGNADLLSKV